MQDWLDKNDLYRDKDRESVYGFGRSAAQKAVWANKKRLLPNNKNAVIPEGKLNGYALNKNHPKGKDKAIAFEKHLGYNTSNADMLEAEVRKGLSLYAAKERTATKYGTPFEVKMNIRGANGKYANVKTGWIIDTDGDAPRLTSIYVDE